MKTDIYYVKVKETPEWDKVYVYCDGQKIDGAFEASVDLGFVKYYNVDYHSRDKYKMKHGKIQILYHQEKEKFMDIDLSNELERVVCGNVDITKILRVIDNYKCRNKE